MGSAVTTSNKIEKEGEGKILSFSKPITQSFLQPNVSKCSYETIQTRTNTSYTDYCMSKRTRMSGENNFFFLVAEWKTKIIYFT